MTRDVLQCIRRPMTRDVLQCVRRPMTRDVLQCVRGGVFDLSQHSQLHVRVVIITARDRAVLSTQH